MGNDFDEYVLPPALVLLRDRLRPICNSLHYSLINREQGWRPGSINPDVLNKALDRICSRLASMDKLINKKIGTLFMEGDAPDRKVQRGLDSLEKELKAFQWDYEYLRSFHLSTEDSYLHDLLLGMYRHLLNEVLEGLLNLLSFLDDPIVWLRRNNYQTTGRVMVTMTITFTPPPQVASLQAWVDSQHTRRCQYVAASRPSQKSSMSFLDMLLLVWLGHEVIEHLIEHND